MSADSELISNVHDLRDYLESEYNDVVIADVGRVSFLVDFDHESAAPIKVTWRALAGLHKEENSEALPLSEVPHGIVSFLYEDALKRKSSGYYGRTNIDDLAKLYLIRPGNYLLKLYKTKIDERHYGDHATKVALFRTMERVGYSSVSSLGHINVTGDSRGGKSDLAMCFLAFLPEANKVVLHSSSPTAVFYLTRDFEDSDEDDKTGRSKTQAKYPQANPEYYSHKVIALLEASETHDSNFTALKALAEETEETPPRITVHKQRPLKLQIKGPRMVLLTSVSGSADEQVLKRFMHSSVQPNDRENKRKKIEKLTDNFLARKDIRDDQEIKVIQSALSRLINGAYVVFEPTEPTAEALIKKLVKTFADNGFSTTNVGHFLTLCETAAFEKRFARGFQHYGLADEARTLHEYCRIEAEDVQEAWFILNTLEKQTKSVLNDKELAILETLLDFSTDQRELAQQRGEQVFYKDRPSQSDITEESGISRATVNRALRIKPDINNNMGKLLELGYVDYGGYELYSFEETTNTKGERVKERRTSNVRYTGFWLTDMGEELLTVANNVVKVDNEEYRPLDPLREGETRIKQGFHTISYDIVPHEVVTEAGEASDIENKENNNKTNNEFHDSIEGNMGRDTQDTLSTGTCSGENEIPEIAETPYDQVAGASLNQKINDVNSLLHDFIPNETERNDMKLSHTVKKAVND